MSAGVEEGRLTASRDAPVGGQAVLEGVMMRGVNSWALAVRKPPEASSEVGEIDVQAFPLNSWAKRWRAVERAPTEVTVAACCAPAPAKSTSTEPALDWPRLAITAKGGRLTPPEGGDGPLYTVT